MSGVLRPSSTIASIWSRRMLMRLEQVPFLRALDRHDLARMLLARCHATLQPTTPPPIATVSGLSPE